MKKQLLLALCASITSLHLQAQNWLTNGNSGLPASSFLGTYDAVPLTLKVRGWRSGLLDHDSLKANTLFGYRSMTSGTGIQNATLGYKSLASNTSGSWNTAFGFQALNKNTTGYSNSANGKEALFSNTTGFGNVGIGNVAAYKNTTGTNNTAIGYKALYEGTTGSFNIGIGSNAVAKNTANKSYIIGIGDSALFNNQATDNLAIGSRALKSVTIGAGNTAVGARVLRSTTNGSGNTGLGFQVLTANLWGSYNTGIGNNSLLKNVGGTNNVAVGSGAMYNNVGGNQHTALGNDALFSNVNGFSSVAIGVGALKSDTSARNTVAIGDSALMTNRYSVSVSGEFKDYYGIQNTAVGSKALLLNRDGYGNTAVGFNAGRNVSVGFNNTALGSGSLNNIANGNENVAIGVQAMGAPGLFNANSNVAIGPYAGNSLQTGASNVLIGNRAGTALKTGSQNVWIGNVIGNTGAVDFSNTVAIGNAIPVGSSAAAVKLDASNKVRIGNDAITSIGGKVGWTTLSDARYKTEIQANVPGLAFIGNLKPVTYRYTVGGDQTRYTGFLAQEVEAAATKIGYTFSGVDKPAVDGSYGLRYAEFVVPLVKAAQELDAQNQKQQEQIDLLSRQVEELKALVSTLATTTRKVSLDASNGEISLGQNVPNPFGGNTVIPFSLPGDCQSAYIRFTETSTGREISRIPVSCREKSISLSTGSLPAGSYTYTLFVNEKAMATKSMMVQN